ncbi:MAG: hypothetical protein ACE5FD_14505, partial [Anaerolineae bacterium]
AKRRLVISLAEVKAWPEADVPFRFLVDPGNRAARQLGLAHENGLPMGFQVMGYDSETVFPTVIITDADGIIRFADLTNNYRIRPEPQTFLYVLDELELQKT